MPRHTHIDSKGQAKMVDVSDKGITSRSARASVTVPLNEQAYDAVRKNHSTKGDILTVARLAGIQAAKQTSALIPLCHQIALDQVST
jgi:molybdenum cofactor biosynthesis protein MoaC